MRHSAFLLGAYLSLISFPTGAMSARVNDESEISKASYFVEGLAPVRKSGSYDITIVYFMDYQCPACRQYTPDVARVLKEDRRLRVIYRDTPLLGPRSDDAARAAIASSFQGRHEPFHHALMTTKGPLDQPAIKAAARKAGVNWPKLERDMISRREDIDLLIGRNVELAAVVGILGTPAFIVGERQSNGALDYESLKLEIADARKELVDGSQSPDPNGRDTVKPEIAKDPKSSATIVRDGERIGTNSPTVNFPTRNGGLRSTDANRDSREGNSWYWLFGGIAGLIGLAAIWTVASRNRGP